MIKLTKIKELPKFETWDLKGSQAPTPGVVEAGYLDLWFSARDNENQSYPAKYALDLSDYSVDYAETKIPNIKLESFDGLPHRNGIMISQVLENGYYATCWNKGSSTVPYRNCIGQFDKNWNLVDFRDRCPGDPIGLSMGFSYMGYLFWMSFDGWADKESIYSIRSGKIEKDGSVSDIKYILKGQYAYARPWVAKRNGLVELWYCYRAFTDFRENKKYSYKIGVLRLINSVWVPINVEGLEDEFMAAYPSVVDNILFYNNTFTGPICIASIEDV